MLRRLVPLLSAAVLMAVTVPVFAAPYVIEHTSMTPAVRPGELVLVDAAIPRFVGYSRGDIVVFQPPAPGYTGPPLIKRVVGLPGETVSIRGGDVFIGARRLIEPYLPAGTRTDNADGPSTWVVPKGAVFVLGDNRGDSWDSRGYGPVPLSAIVGQAWLGIGPMVSLGMAGPMPVIARR